MVEHGSNITPEVLDMLVSEVDAEIGINQKLIDEGRANAV